MTIEEIMKQAQKTAIAKGWLTKEKDDRTIGDLIALCHSELSEALEEYRSPRYRPTGANKHGPAITLIHDTVRVQRNTIHPVLPDDGAPSEGKPEGFPIELADCIIRICQMAQDYDIDLTRAIKVKMDYNKTRSHRHGGKKI